MTTKNAVILVAGEGKRLLPFTLTHPKCFAPVAGKRILENALESLSANGCKEARIVVGHHAELIRESITDRFANMTIQYIFNPIYKTTNSMYSLALGLEGLESATWVIEGDVFLERSIFGLHAPHQIAWFVDSTTRSLDGAFVEHCGNSTAISLQIIRDLKLLKPNQSKSIGVIHLSELGVLQLRGWLQEGIQAGRQNQYYDLILGDHMDSGVVHIVDVAGRKWFEIDSNEDLSCATELFTAIKSEL